MPETIPLHLMLSRYLARYQQARQHRVLISGVLVLAIAGALAWRLQLSRVPPAVVVGAGVAAALLGWVALAWGLRRGRISRAQAAEDLDRALGLEQRLVTAAECLEGRKTSELYPALLADVEAKATSPTTGYPKPWSRTSSVLVALLALLLFWPYQGKLPLGLKPPQLPFEPPPELPTPLPPPHSPDQQQQSPQSGGGSTSNANNSPQNQNQPPPSSSSNSSGASGQSSSLGQSQNNQPANQGQNKQGQSGAQGQGQQGAGQQGQQGAQQQSTGQESGGQQSGKAQSANASGTGQQQSSGAQQQPGQQGQQGQQGAGQQAGTSQQAGQPQPGQGDQQALKGEIQQLLKEMSGQVKELQGQLSQMEQNPPPGTDTDPDSLFDDRTPLDPLTGAPLPMRLETDTAATKAPRRGGGTGKSSGDVGTEGPEQQAQDAQLSATPTEQAAVTRQPVPPEYRPVFERLQSTPPAESESNP